LPAPRQTSEKTSEALRLGLAVFTSDAPDDEVAAMQVLRAGELPRSRSCQPRASTPTPNPLPYVVVRREEPTPSSSNDRSTSRR